MRLSWSLKKHIFQGRKERKHKMTTYICSDCGAECVIKLLNPKDKDERPEFCPICGNNHIKDEDEVKEQEDF